MLEYLRRNLSEISPTQDPNLVVSLMRIFRTLLEDLETPEAYAALDAKQRVSIIDSA